MERWKESQLRQIASATEVDIAYQGALSFAKNIGYKFFEFSATYTTKPDQLNTLKLNNYPASWNNEYEQKQLRDVDPVVAHCNQSMLPILWSEELFSKIPSMWEALGLHGIQHGWSQSVHDDESGLCSILSLARSHCPISAFELYEMLGFSVFIARHLHALVAQTLPKRGPKPAAAHLSLREIDVLKLAADGKTAEESARILNLSARTINFHVRSAIDKLGVNNKISAVIAAVKAGYLGSGAMR
ncbi:autoinducer binding domain-containing protein [Pseudomonas sp. V98_8]|jgi:LuxR family transcriptional regulator|uniref:helix-turn-helix transcriptional regulator n=1 Tax=unclassified Pseudomonas TaxID=196821 RepID=UPI001660E4D8|nr:MULTISPECIES: autoinducer binding domain-containing protein [unclassified Pseudomonas]MBD0679712.1 LuxR family transcriptional regulator [Pseudomonas sp. PSB11]MDI3392199.1 autoinducer binding domain-containing protein [Pseudomonas sp. V98_8]MDP9690097.1 LuxR family transcriptional regulator [Pseudomonas mohnii]